MPTHKPSTGELSLTELRAATGLSAPTIKARLGMAPAIRPVRSDRRTAWFSAPEALRRILAPAAGAGEGAEVLDLAAERAALARAQTIGQEHRNAEASRAMIPRADVLQHWAGMVLNAREQLRNIPSVALVRVPGFTRAMAKPLAELIDAALTELGSGRNGVPPVRKHRGMRVASNEVLGPEAA